MQEFLNLLKEMKRGDKYSETDAIVDIFIMADENGKFYSTARNLMNRWKWGSSKTVSFIEDLKKRNIIRTQTEHKQNTLFIVNTEFLDSKRNTNGTQTEHKRNTKEERAVQLPAMNNAQIMMKKPEVLRMISDAWSELLYYGIEPIPENGISDAQYESIKVIAKRYSVKDIIETMQRIKSSSFLQGKVGKTWKVTFNWFIKIGNYEKVRGGEYDGIRESTGSVYMDAIKNRVNIVDEW